VAEDFIPPRLIAWSPPPPYPNHAQRRHSIAPSPDPNLRTAPPPPSSIHRVLETIPWTGVLCLSPTDAPTPPTGVTTSFEFDQIQSDQIRSDAPFTGRVAMVNPGPCSNGKSKEDGDDGNEALGGGGGRGQWGRRDGRDPYFVDLVPMNTQGMRFPHVNTSIPLFSAEELGSSSRRHRFHAQKFILLFAVMRAQSKKSWFGCWSRRRCSGAVAGGSVSIPGSLLRSLI
jgi:hypothetical protein